MSLDETNKEYEWIDIWETATSGIKINARYLAPDINGEINTIIHSIFLENSEYINLNEFSIKQEIFQKIIDVVSLP